MITLTRFEIEALFDPQHAVPFAEGLNDAEHVTELGAALVDPTLGRESVDEITIADLTGLGAQDIAMAKIVLEA